MQASTTWRRFYFKGAQYERVKARVQTPRNDTKTIPVVFSTFVGDDPKGIMIEMSREEARELAKRLLTEAPAENRACADCGGTDVQRVMWVDINTEIALDDFGSENELDTIFCPDCEGHGVDTVEVKK